jgi:hypothetical protein
LSLSAHPEGEDIRLKLSGNGDAETPGTLAIYLRKVHAEVPRVRARSVIVDCDDLYFMSTACIKCLATWIDSIVQLDSAERYEVTFSPNPHLAWQPRAFEDLRRSAPSLVRIVDSLSTTGASTLHAAAAPVSGSLRQSQVLPHLGTDPQAGAPHSATPLAKGSSSETMRQAKASTSETMRQAKASTSETMRQAKASTSETMRQAKGSSSETMRQAKGSSSETMRQAKGSSSETMRQAKGSPSGTMPQTKGSPSETLPQTKGAPSATMPKTGTISQAPAARRRR